MAKKYKNMKEVTLGMIGCGYWGPNFARNFSKIEGVKVKSICDLNHQRLAFIKENYPDIETTDNYLKLINDPAIEAVVISTWAISHFKLAKDSLLREKHVLVEKPIALKIDEAEGLIDLAKAKNKVLMVGHTFRFNPGIIKLKSLVKHGALGKIYYIYTQRTNLGPLRRDVNALWDLAPHDISIISYLLDSQPLDVSAKGTKFLEHDLEDVAFLSLSYPKNIFAHIHVSWLDPRKVREVIIVGNKKMAVFNDLDQSRPITVYDKRVVKQQFRQDYATFEEFQMIIKSGKASSVKVNPCEPLALECRHFIECIKNNKNPLTDGRDGLNVLRVLIAAQKSISNHGKIFKLS